MKKDLFQLWFNHKPILFSYILELQVIDLELHHQRKGDLTQGICKWGTSPKALRKKCNRQYYFEHPIKCRFGVYWLQLPLSISYRESGKRKENS